ncbi:hypothetical protein, partial [Burkholderia ubonensis]|uniref:hypothetical protein n=1 Tax=Burkholderia ubonensis TaxID=101571 RepID=UPI001E3051D8
MSVTTDRVLDALVNLNQPVFSIPGAVQVRFRIYDVARLIPLHTSLLLKLARVCDAGSKIHHSL